MTLSYLPPSPVELEAPDRTVAAMTVCRRARISYRQLDHWTRTGLLHPLEATLGSGHARAYPIAELAAASLVKRLLEAGMQPRPAFAIARDLLEHGHAHLAGIRIDLPQDL